MRSKQEKLNEFELHVIKLALTEYLKNWELSIIEAEEKGKRGFFASSYPKLVYNELERKLNLENA